MFPYCWVLQLSTVYNSVPTLFTFSLKYLQILYRSNRNKIGTWPHSDLLDAPTLIYSLSVSFCIYFYTISDLFLPYVSSEGSSFITGFPYYSIIILFSFLGYWNLWISAARLLCRCDNFNFSRHLPSLLVHAKMEKMWQFTQVRGVVTVCQARTP